MTEESKKSKRKWEPEIEDNSLTPWFWAGMRFEKYDRLSTSARRWWAERWQARVEAKWRLNGKPVCPSGFDPESLDEALFRLAMSSRGDIIDNDPLGYGGPRHVEDHTPPDARPWNVIADEARYRAQERIASILERRTRP